MEQVTDKAAALERGVQRIVFRIRAENPLISEGQLNDLMMIELAKDEELWGIFHELMTSDRDFSEPRL